MEGSRPGKEEGAVHRLWCSGRKRKLGFPGQTKALVPDFYYLISSFLDNESPFYLVEISPLVSHGHTEPG